MTQPLPTNAHVLPDEVRSGLGEQLMTPSAAGTATVLAEPVGARRQRPLLHEVGALQPVRDRPILPALSDGRKVDWRTRPDSVTIDT